MIVTVKYVGGISELNLKDFKNKMFVIFYVV